MRPRFDETAMGHPLMGTLFGMRILSHPMLERKPKLKLGPCAVGDEFRAKFDAWLVEQFGYEPEVAYVIDSGLGPIAFLSPSSVAKITNIGA